MKNTLEGINNRSEFTEQISNMEVRIVEISLNQNNKKK